MKEVILTKGLVTLVDDEDYPNLSRLGWFACSHGGKFYACSQAYVQGKRIHICMHREIIGAEKGQHVDHVDRNPLNNQKHNLRICSRRQNQCNIGLQRSNKSGFKGVSWSKSGNKWTARISTGETYKHLGLFLSAVEAAKAYNEAAKIFHGEFAFLNPV